jgi:probable rRNA maturation factor
MKETILGKKYELSIVLAGDKRTQRLNATYRGKTYTPNVLSFPLDKEHGEIFLNLRQARREHKKRSESYDYFVALLVVHGMLHLKGMAHGSTMEKQEQALLSKFGIKNTVTPQ